MSTLTINNERKLTSSIEDVSQGVDSCMSCWTVKVNVPDGQTRTVKFTHNMGIGGVSYPCMETQADYAISNDQTFEISSTKTFSFGISAASILSTTPYSSSVTVKVLNNGSTLQSKTYSRAHNDQQC